MSKTSILSYWIEIGIQNDIGTIEVLVRNGADLSLKSVLHIAVEFYPNFCAELQSEFGGSWYVGHKLLHSFKLLFCEMTRSGCKNSFMNSLKCPKTHVFNIKESGQHKSSLL